MPRVERPTATPGALPGAGATFLAPGTRLRRRLRMVVFAWAVIGTLLAVGTLQLHLTSDPLADVHAYYDAGARLNAGSPLYVQTATTNDAEFYRYPPLLAIAFRPLALLPFGAAAAIWETVVLASFVLTIWLLGVRRDDVWLAVGILGLPIGWSIAIGQAQVPATLLMALGSPVAIALAGQLKVLPALVAIYWLGRRDWTALARFIGATAVLVVAQVALEPRGSLDFLGAFGLSQVGEVRNISPYVISPILWVGLLIAGALVAVRLAPTRWGWAAAVALSVLASPRLLVYTLMSLLATLRRPPAREPAPGLPTEPIS
jgi:hypothetical protein